jgi:transcriptional regulator with XRE-family HTH domain
MDFLGEKIKKARKALGITQEELAGRTFTKSYISQIERGVITPSVKALDILSQTLGKPLSSFLETDPEESIKAEKDLPAMLLESQNLFSNEDYSGFLEKFCTIQDHIRSLDENSAVNLLFYAGRSYYALGKYEDALTHSIKALEYEESMHNRDKFRLYKLFGEIYYDMKDKNSSLNYFIKSLDLIDNLQGTQGWEEHFEILRDVGILHAQLGNANSSIQFLNSIIRLSREKKVVNSVVLDAFKGISDIYYLDEKHKSLDRALSYMDEALPLYDYFQDSTSKLSAYVRFISIYYEMKDYQRCREFMEKFEEAISKSPSVNPEILSFYNMFRGKLLALDGKNKDAESFLMKALSGLNHPNPSADLLSAKARALFSLGEFYHESRNLDLAVKYCSESISLLEELSMRIFLPQAYRLMARLLIKLGKTSEGEEYYDKAFDILSK